MTESDMREKIEAVMAACESQIDAAHKRDVRLRKALKDVRQRLAKLEHSLERPLPAYHLERVRIRLEVWRSAERLLAKAVE